MRYLILVLFVSPLVILSCSNQSTGKELMPEMGQTDSIELIYFRAPDSLRNFTYLPLNDEEFIKEIVDNVSGTVQEENACPKEGKIYCFKKGQLFNTIFFGYSQKDCMLFHYVKNGKPYYFKMSSDVKEKLAKFKSFARDPQDQDTTENAKSPTR